MDNKSARDKDTAVDLESGLAVIDDDSSEKVSTSGPGTAKQEKMLFAKFSSELVGGSVKAEDRQSLYCNESNLNGVSIDVVKVTNKSLAGQDSVDRAEKTPVKEKCKKASNKKAPKPPRPPRAPPLDAADHKLIREISELAMLKRARKEHMKALKKMKVAKSSSSSSRIFAMVFTVVFCIVILLQGMSSGKSSVASFQGSPVSAGGAEGGLIAVQYHLNPSASDPNALGSGSHNFVHQVAGSDLPQKTEKRYNLMQFY